ncbi:MAG: hypothetical protein DWQ47_06520 [Acidobacteria bacterium]|nr:MAG: hypothetical protein DWQ32_10070 [Acidobacteriota bacterium]REK02027.1 MAG: hypothetical protein DWQ38_06500 [Acidobacteriota bacterium]REK14985.1 MAG: hypothetical protein DWQ43_15760 [Acidobacteriota bacterium]REK45699.1 MAG: hypothetical protein DWQ47_06520 [Acidobacteriota bacterium]
MNSKKINIGLLAYCFAFVSIACVAVFLVVGAKTADAKSEKASDNVGGISFPGTGTGAIPDGSSPCPSFGSSLDISFAVTGVTAPLSDVALSHTISHTWVGDLDVRLIAPDATEHVIYSRVESASGDCFGDSSNLSGVYSFDDVGGPTNFWDAAFNAPGSGDIIANGNYRTTAAGPDDTPPADETDMTAAFSSVADPNGTWTLRVRDANGFDTGTVTEATLTLTGGAAPSGPTVIDFDGDGQSDYSVVRNDTPPFAGGEGSFDYRSLNKLSESGMTLLEARKSGVNENPGNKNDANGAAPPVGTNLSWWIANSNSSAGIHLFGEPTTDFWVPADYDGDGQADLAVWRGLNATGPDGGFFYIFRSSDSTLDTIDFGIQGDNPTVTGDYDGDDLADIAVYRCPSGGGGQCTFFYRGSDNNPGGDITFVPWGNNSSSNVRPYPGDLDGDGKFDFTYFQDGVYTALRSSDLGFEAIPWGSATDPVLAPGDYDGDGMTDLANVRVNGSTVEWWIAERDGGGSIGGGPYQWGALIAGYTEFVATGDFDGDGATDIGIWRRNNADPNDCFFYVRRSSDLALETYEWGDPGDAPVPGWNSN